MNYPSPHYFHFERLKPRDWLELSYAFAAMALGSSMLIASRAEIASIPSGFVQGTAQIAGGLSNIGFSSEFVVLGTVFLTAVALTLGVLKALGGFLTAIWVAVTAPGVALAYLAPGLKICGGLMAAAGARAGAHRVWFWHCPAAMYARKKWREGLNRDAKSGLLDRRKRR